jgi:hypothetical protein
MYLTWIVAAVVSVCGIVSITAFDRLVKIEREEFVDAWMRDGKPHPLYLSGGLRWERTFRTGRRSQRCLRAWSASKPEWVNGHAIAGAYQRRLGLASKVSLIAFATVVIALVYRAMM